MREIKFRVWDTFYKKWIEVNAIDFDNEVIFVVGGVKMDFEKVEIMQFTGLFDNTKWEDLPQYEQQLFRISLGTQFGEEAKKKWKGKEIYEGDIIVLDCGDERIYVVEYIIDTNQSMCGFYLKRIIDSKIYSFGSFNVGIKVIGNKFENGELLK